jgi:hypothetical protein
VAYVGKAVPSVMVAVCGLPGADFGRPHSACESPSRGFTEQPAGLTVPQLGLAPQVGSERSE